MGSTGIFLSEISLGAWMTYGSYKDQEESTRLITAALDLGINTIDLANVYGSGTAEKYIGDLIQKNEIDRNELILTSKVFMPQSDDINNRGLGRKHIQSAIGESLERLQTDYIDIYFCHRFDYETPLEETIRTMTGLIDKGLINYWGTSQWTAVQIERVNNIAKNIGCIGPSVEQPRYNLLDREIEKEVIDTCDYHGMGIMCWSPLAQGILTGKYLSQNVPKKSRLTYARTASERWFEQELNENNRDKISKLKSIADENNVSLAQLSLAWILKNKSITSTITGFTKMSHIDDNIQSVSVDLDKDVLTEIERIMANKPTLPKNYDKYVIR